MKFDSMTDKAIAAEIGERIEQLRLERNLTQQQLADHIGLSRVSYRHLVAGNGKFVNVIAVMLGTLVLNLVNQKQVMLGLLIAWVFSCLL